MSPNGVTTPQWVELSNKTEKVRWFFFQVDPLFKKTSAAFDEGGTGGLLLNHLRCLDDSSELVLDSNTVVYGADEVLRDPEHGRAMVDLRDLRGTDWINS